LYRLHRVSHLGGSGRRDPNYCDETPCPSGTSKRSMRKFSPENEDVLSRTLRLSIAALIFGLPGFAGSACGIRNFDQVDPLVYRGGQPTDDGLRCLARLGVKTIIDLRKHDQRAKAEEHMVTSAGMKYVNVPMSGLEPPTDAQIAQILVTLENGAAGPVFVHCRRGADRTGVVIAAYHIDHEQWGNALALSDAEAHGMGLFQLPRKAYIKNFRPAKNAPHSIDPTPAGPMARQAALTNPGR